MFKLSIYSFKKVHVFLLFLILSFSNYTCKIDSETKEKIIKIHQKLPENTNRLPPTEFDRTEIKSHLEKKLKQKRPFIAHILVPLCDNENQGIVPVSKSLGDGRSLRTNLYWGALYGLKTHFKKLSNWTVVYEQKDLNINVLERVVFEKKNLNGATVQLIIDAYAGDKMKVCLEDFFNSLAGEKTDLLSIENKTIGLYGEADLLGFNGHNGLMDVQVKAVTNTDSRAKDAVVIGCVSYDYFKEHLKIGKGFPLLTTTNLMAPEAYVLAGTLDAWANFKPETEVREAAAAAYNQYQKCGIRGARNLFKSGW